MTSLYTSVLLMQLMLGFALSGFWQLPCVGTLESSQKRQGRRFDWRHASASPDPHVLSQGPQGHQERGVD